MARASVLPDRIRRAVELLGLVGGEHVLEVGAGSGVAAAHLLDRHPGLTYVAVDRSATAVARARARCPEAVAVGRLALHPARLEDLGPDVVGPRPFDVAFAVDVNAFWTTAAVDPARRLAALLADPGDLWLVYGQPTAGRTGLTDRLVASLAVDDLEVVDVVRDEVLALHARRRPR